MIPRDATERQIRAIQGMLARCRAMRGVEITEADYKNRVEPIAKAFQNGINGFTSYTVHDAGLHISMLRRLMPPPKGEVRRIAKDVYIFEPTPDKTLFPEED